MTAVHMQRPVRTGQSIAEVKQGAAVVEDQIQALRRAREHLAAQLVDAKRRYQFAESETRSALENVLWNSNEVRQLLTDLQTGARTRLELLAALNEIGDYSDDVRKAWRDSVASLSVDASTVLPL